jgi:type IV secretory pathway VirB3-like protein
MTMFVEVAAVVNVVVAVVVLVVLSLVVEVDVNVLSAYLTETKHIFFFIKIRGSKDWNNLHQVYS